MSKFIIATFLLLLSLSCIGQTINFPSADGLEITADLYIKHDKQAPFIVLFHQAGWSRGEYLEIAPKLNELGFNCMAIDQRSGDKINDIANETHQRAVKKSLGVSFVDALPDMYAAIAFAKKNYVGQKLIIWGSSYSSALVLKIMGDHPDICDAGLSFAPGEYFERFGKGNDYITLSAKHISKPIFITSAKAEKDNWWDIYEQIPTTSKTYFIPNSEGNHGSRALWEKFDDHPEYWKALVAYLEIIQ